MIKINIFQETDIFFAVHISSCVFDDFLFFGWRLFTAFSIISVCIYIKLRWIHFFNYLYSVRGRKEMMTKTNELKSGLFDMFRHHNHCNLFIYRMVYPNLEDDGFHFHSLPTSNFQNWRSNTFFSEWWDEVLVLWGSKVVDSIQKVKLTKILWRARRWNLIKLLRIVRSFV